MSDLTVICCRSDSAAAGSDPAVKQSLAACTGRAVAFVGRRPGKEIDPLLVGRVMVIGTDDDLAAVALRLLRRELLGEVMLAYATDQPTQITDRWALPTGSRAIALAVNGDPDLVPLVRDDAGGVLLGLALIKNLTGTIYVDETRVLRGAAKYVTVQPDPEKGLVVSIVWRRRLLMFGRQPKTFIGRATEIGGAKFRVMADDVTRERMVDHWTFYKHTQPLRLIRGVV